MMSREDQRILDILERLSLCQECLGELTGGVVFGCGTCLEAVARDVVES